MISGSRRATTPAACSRELASRQRGDLPCRGVQASEFALGPAFVAASGGRRRARVRPDVVGDALGIDAIGRAPGRRFPEPAVQRGQRLGAGEIGVAQREVVRMHGRFLVHEETSRLEQRQRGVQPGGDVLRGGSDQCLKPAPSQSHPPALDEPRLPPTACVAGQGSDRLLAPGSHEPRRCLTGWRGYMAARPALAKSARMSRTSPCYSITEGPDVQSCAAVPLQFQSCMGKPSTSCAPGTSRQWLRVARDPRPKREILAPARAEAEIPVFVADAVTGPHLNGCSVGGTTPSVQAESAAVVDHMDNRATGVLADGVPLLVAINDAPIDVAGMLHDRRTLGRVDRREALLISSVPDRSAGVRVGR